MTRAERLWLLSLLAMMPFLMGAYCSIGREIVPSPRSRSPVSDDIQDIVFDFQFVTPFVTLTPTPTPTLTPTLILTTTAPGQGAGAGAGPGAGNGGPPPDSTPEDGTPIAEISPTPAQRLTSTPTPSPSPSLTPSVSPSPTPSATPTLFFTPSPTASPTLLPTPTPTTPPTDEPDDSTPDPSPPTNTPAPPTETATPIPPTDTATPIPPTDTPVPINISFASSVYTIDEGGGNAQITVTLSLTPFQTIEVDYSTTTGTAFVGVDYLAANGTLTFSPGQISRSFTVPILQDNVDDPNIEDIALRLKNPVNAVLGTDQATLQINDDDPEPVLSFANAAYTTLENQSPILTVILDRPSGKIISFSYGPTGNGTATPNIDYNPSALGVKLFGPDLTGVGPTTVTFTWSGLINDTITGEADETVELGLTSPINASLGSPATTLLTIQDDD